MEKPGRYKSVVPTVKKLRIKKNNDVPLILVTAGVELKISHSPRFFFLFFLCSLAGAIFEQGTEEIQAVFKHAMLQYNMNNSQKRFELQAFVDVINTADAFKLSRLSE